MRRLEYLWRLFGTGFSFALFGLGGLALSLTAFPVTNLLVRAPARRADRAQRLVHRAFRVYVRLMIAMGVIDFDVTGAEKLAGDRGTLIVANHPTLLDVVLLMSLMERAQCIVKSAIWRNPFMRSVVSATDYIRNDGDPERLIEDCATALKDCNNIIVFPEGSRTVPGVPMKLQRGVANVALRADAPIRLVTIACEPSTLRKGQKWYDIPATRAHFFIAVHELIEPGRFSEDAPSSAIAARRLTAYLGDLLRERVANGPVGSQDPSTDNRRAES
jgi:1-acyl-sn-glycerol-3-phosphate acyltransferase